MRELKKIPKGYSYRCAWGHASYTHMQASVNIYDDEDDKNVVLEISDKNETFLIMQLSIDEYRELSREYPVHDNGCPILYYFGYFREEN